MKARIDSAKPSRTFNGTNGPVQVYEVVAGGVVYDCMSERVTKLIGQEVEFEVKQPSDPQYHPTMKLPKEGGSQFGGGGKWGGKGYTVAFEQTAEGQKLKTKAMLMSYAKDMSNDVNITFTERLKNAQTAYTTLLPLLGLDQIKDPKPPEQNAGGNGAGSSNHKDLKTLLDEMKALTSLDALSKWWSTIPASYNALSATDQSTLVGEKDKKKAELKPATTAAQTGRVPGF